MLIQKKRIRNIDNYIPNFDGRDIYIAHSLPDAGKTDSIGFSSQRALGEEVLPKILGPITRFNANGKSVPDKTAPKETAYRQISWTRKQWIGGGATQEVTDTREIEYKRYKRILTPPPSIELKIVVNRPGFPGECFICELRLPDHRFRWKHNKLFLLLPEEYGPAFPAIVDCYTSPPT